MSDAQQRELYRQAVTGDPGAQARLWREKVRSREQHPWMCEILRDGRIYPGRAGPTLAPIGRIPASFERGIELAAFLGHELAQACLEREHPYRRASEKDLDLWLSMLNLWLDVPLRLSIAGARECLWFWEEQNDGGCDSHNGCRCASPIPRIALEAAESYAVDQTKEKLQQWHVKFTRGENDRLIWLPMPEDTSSERSRSGEVKGAISYLDEGTIRTAISNELIPWALGIRDPVRDRVAKC